MSDSRKQFKLSAAEIRTVAPGHGACIATDRITVDGLPVRFMYREVPRDRVDSGWRFFAGVESQEYVDDPTNLLLYDVNTIANYDPSIIPFLDAPVGAAFERHDGAGVFAQVEFEPPAE